jgi:serine/threonine-protein kinase
MVGKEIGPYRILQKLAQGGMCSVYKGMHIGLEQEVAIKVLSSEAFDDRSLRDRFINEAKIQAKLSHPNVVKTLNYLEQDNMVVLVMEYINGETLDVLMKKTGTLSLDKAFAILDSVFDAVDFMHSKGIVHRDIKPANIMLPYEGSVKVMDFGIAKVVGEIGNTRTGIRIGTIWYMSPEQIRGTSVGLQSDIYSIGVMLYQMVTGRMPFSGETEFDIMKSHIEDTPPAPWKINSNIPREIGRIILKAIAKNPKERYQSVKELAAEIRKAAKPPNQTIILAEPYKKEQKRKDYFVGLFEPLKWRIVALIAIGIAALAMLILYLAKYDVRKSATTDIGSQTTQPAVRNIDAVRGSPPVTAAEKEKSASTKSKKKTPLKVNPADTTKGENGIKSSASVQSRNAAGEKKLRGNTEPGSRDEKKKNFKADGQWKIIK